MSWAEIDGMDIETETVSANRVDEVHLDVRGVSEGKPVRYLMSVGRHFEES